MGRRGKRPEGTDWQNLVSTTPRGVQDVKCVLVFDGSAKQCGVLLNKCLEMGLNLQADVVSVALFQTVANT
ncbi:hypothetical protein T09_4322 [Trichinella sp. T9]|nr:hypothetical protein T09_4322 [Trichinella sp. T9]